MKIISIIVGKIVLFLCELIGRGSAFPGEFTYKLNKNILKDLEKPKLIIAVTGSSGKGSTTKIIANVFKKLNYKIAFNDKDSNERGAIITTLLKNSTITGKAKTDVGIFEVDERYVKYIFPDLKPNYVVINNITRDQPPRQRHYDFVLSEIEKGLTKDMNLILNADDPYLHKLALENKYNITYFGINKLKTSYKTNNFPVLNINRCLKCHNKLEYNYYQIEHLGDYYCPKCDFKRPKCDYEITDFKDNTITINNKYNIKLNSDILFNLYNTAGAFTVLSLCKLPLEKCTKIISDTNTANKNIYDKYKYNNKDIYVLNNKNENATTFNESILYAKKDKELKTVVIGWWQISRRYDFDDLSWLYDIEFELLKDNTKEFIVCGPQRYDLAVRLKYANIDPKDIKIYENLEKAQDEIKNVNTNIYAILNFDYIKPFNNIMKEDK